MEGRPWVGVGKGPGRAGSRQPRAGAGTLPPPQRLVWPAGRPLELKPLWLLTTSGPRAHAGSPRFLRSSPLVRTGRAWLPVPATCVSFLTHGPPGDGRGRCLVSVRVCSAHGEAQVSWARPHLLSPASQARGGHRQSAWTGEPPF